MKYSIVLLIILTTFSGCGSSNKPNDLTFLTDFESYAGWNCIHMDILKTKDAHSGNYVFVFDSAREWSCIFSLKFSEISIAKPIRGVNISCWAYSFSDLLNSDLVVEIFDANGKPISWDSKQIAENLQGLNEWFLVKHRVEFAPRKLNAPEYTFKFYVKKKGNYQLWIDDIKIEFET